MKRSRHTAIEPAEWGFWRRLVRRSHTRASSEASSYRHLSRVPRPLSDDEGNTGRTSYRDGYHGRKGA